MTDQLNIDNVYCLVCKKRHFPDEDTFLTFYGNVTIGMNGGIIGNNFDDEGKVCKVQYVCRSLNCLQKLFEIKDQRYRDEVLR